MSKATNSTPGDAADVITAQDMAEVGRGQLDKAKQGDTPAAAIIERMYRRRARPIRLALPPITDAKSVAEAHAEVIKAAAGDHITPREGVHFTTMIEHRRRALETVDYETRLQRIEDNLAKQAEQKAKERR